MVEITPLHDRLVLKVKGWHKLWAFRSQLTIPLEHIKDVYADPHPVTGWFHGWRVLGTSIPHVLQAGLFLQEGNMVFWDVHDMKKTIIFDLEDEFFAQLIVEVADPETAVLHIQEKLARYQAAKAAEATEL